LLTALLLSVFAFVSPVVMLHSQVALLVVTPSVSLTQPSSSKGVDGPSLFLGMLGSCSRHNNDGDVSCTLPTISPVYDTSVLPSNAPNLLLSAPAASTPAFVGVALAFSVMFFFTFTLISFRHKMGAKLSAALDKPMIQRFSAWIGVFGFLIGLTSFLIVRMWFGKAVDDFNSSIQSQGNGAPELIASTSNGFTMVWVAYAFHAIPVIASLAKLNVAA
ncbi:hypothetical protein PLICRDRAFT_78471, partial [Plicaturopsis crispa FD-325 SS-3]